MNKQNCQIFTNTVISEKMHTLCQAHKKPIGNNFCIDCLSYLVCTSCIFEKHSGHQVVGFLDINETKYETRQILLQSLEQTLKSLKRRQNEVKNKSAQIELLKNNLKTLQNDVLRQISEIFKAVEQELSEVVAKQQQNLQGEVSKFYTEYNIINDELRDHLLKIMDCQVNIFQFHKQMIIKLPPACPNFDLSKSYLQKHRKVLKNIHVNLCKIKQNLDSSRLGSRNNCNAQVSSRLDKYLQNTKTTDKVNESFMRTLNLIEKQNIPLLNLCKLYKK